MTPVGVAVAVFGIPSVVTWLLPAGMLLLNSDPLARADLGASSGLGESWWLPIPFALSGVAACLVIVGKPISLTPRHVSGRRASLALGGSLIASMATVLVPAVLLGLSADALWRLGGEERYGTATFNATGIAFVASSIAGSSVLYGILSLRQRVNVALVILAAANAGLMLGRGIRAPFIAAMLTFALVPILHRRLEKGGSRRRTRSSNLARLSVAGLVATIGMSTVALLRGGESVGAIEPTSALQIGLRSLDTLSSTEAVLEAGFGGGFLAGDNLLTNLAFFAPRALFPNKPTSFPISDRVLSEVLPGRFGTSVPLWTAGFVDLGILGLAVYGVLFGLFAAVALRHVATRLASAPIAYVSVGLACSHLLARHSLLQSFVGLSSLMLFASIYSRLTRIG